MSNYNKYHKEVYQVSYNGGNTWEDVTPVQYRRGSLIQADSPDCGYVPPTPPVQGQPFTIVPLEKDMKIEYWGEVGQHTVESVKVYYSYDLGETWEHTIGDFCVVNVNLGQKVSLWIDDNGGECSSGWGILNKNSEDTVLGKFYVEGDLKSMLPCDNYKGYFKGKTHLVSAENLMIPEDRYCEEMFAGCTSLTTAPVLSAATLTENQYKNMFSGCTSLNYIKCLATDISASGCTEGWVTGVPSSGTFIKNSSMNSWPTGSSGIPSGWAIQNA